MEPALFFVIPAALAFSPPPDAQQPLGRGPVLQPAVVDIDLDGHDDLVWADGNRLHHWRGPIPGPYPGLLSTFTSHSPLGGATARADIDADGVPEVVFQVLVPGPDYSVGELEAWQAAVGGPVLSTASTIAASGPAGYAMTGGADLDGNGAEDIVSGVSIFLGTAGGLSAASALPEARYSNWMRPLGDLDGDGDDEVISNGYVGGGVTAYYGQNEGLLVQSGDGSGGAEVFWAYPSGFELCVDAVAADLDGDSVDEVVGLCFDFYEDGELVLLDDVGTRSPTVVTSTPIASSSLPRYITLAGFDHDSDGVDELFLSTGSAMIEVPWDAKTGFDPGGGTVRFESPIPSASARWASTDDVSGDGSDDLVVLFMGSGTTASRGLAVWLGDAAGVETGDTGAPHTAHTGGTGDTALPGDTAQVSTDTSEDTGVDAAAGAGSEPDEGCGCVSQGTTGGGWLVASALSWVRRRRG